ncbi:S8 family serine peptidase [bacterium]|nr:S8 family serine peptidase [bacterium]
MKRALVVLPAVLCLLCAQYLRAGEIAPDLAERWSKVAPDEKVNAIFHLWERVDLRELDITLRDLRVTRQQRHQIVIEELQRVARETQPPLLADLEAMLNQGEIDGFTAYWITNCVVVKGPRETMENLAKHDLVQWVEAVPVPELIAPVVISDRTPRQPLDSRTQGVNALRAPQVWYELGYTGAGRLVANMDTGVDGNHQALGSRWRGNHAPHAHCWLDVLGGGSQTPQDAQSHGTHVMGTICGTGGPSSQFDTVGVAPGAEWIAMNAIGGFGADFNSDVLQGYQWFADPDGNPGTIEDVPDVIQNSWGVYGGFAGYTDCFQFWNDAIIACETAGTVVVFSAGNEGPAPASHRSPANIAIDSVTFFSVGAVNANSFPNAPYPVVGFSSRGPSDCDATAIKPEVVAPGEDVYSSIPGNNYGSMSGTSMAGPHVAGIVALMREANPNADVREIKGVLLQTAIDYAPTGDDNTSGRGFVDAYEAVLLISANRGWLVGQITNANNNQPISGARVQAGENFVRFSDSQGNYRISLPADSTLPITVTAFGYAAFSTSMSVADSDTVTLNIQMNPVASGTLNGTVLIADDVPLQGANITPQGIPVGPLQSDVNGFFSYSLPGNNTYSFRITFQDITIDTSFAIPVDGTVNAVIRMASQHSQPTGPDSYGYRAYERFDYGLTAPYAWADMTNATVVPMLDILNVSAFIEMPFPFCFYGERYDSVTINENGWVAPGGDEPDRRANNTPIPNVAGPAGMLALYWDDLTRRAGQTPSRLLTRYDEQAGVFIIEYRNFIFALDTTRRFTGQIHIFNQEVWPTPTGDCEIMFVYDELGVLNAATIGIENPAENTGVLYRYNANQDPTTFALERGTAILFTTRTSVRTLGNLTGTITTHPAITQAIPNGVRLGNALAQVSTNGSYSFNNVFAGPRTLRVQIPGYEQMAFFATLVTNQTTTLNADVWRLDPPTGFSYSQAEDSLFLSWQPPVSVGGLDEHQGYVIYFDTNVLDTTAALSYTTRIPGVDFHMYWVTALYDGGESLPTDTIIVQRLAADETAGIPTEFAMSPAYPNPFNPSTSLNVSLPQSAELSLRIYDIVGREVAVIAQGRFQPGNYRMTWNAEGSATGVYFARLESPLGSKLQKLLLLK